MIIGVTGGIGSGKSTFVNALAELGCTTIRADGLGKELTDNDTEIRSALRESFGDAVFDDRGKLKRRDLGRLVFSNPESLKELNNIIQEPLLKKIQSRITQFRQLGKAHIVLDMATLFETGAYAFCEINVVVTAPVEKRIHWLVESNRWTEKEVRDRMASQMSDEEKVKLADYEIKNNSTIQSLQNEAKHFFSQAVLQKA